MKQLYTFFCTFLFIALSGQVLNNFDFENWVTLPNTFGGEDPAGWKSTNAATAGGNIKAIEKSTDPYSGTYALSIKPLIGFDNSDTLTAAIVLGTAPLNFQTYKLDYEKGGQPIANKKISSVSGYYKLEKGFQTYDSVYAVVLLKDAFSPGSAGTGSFVFQSSQNYIPFSINIAGNIGTADTLVIAFFYRSNSATPFSNASLLIDSLKYTEFIDLTSLQKNEKENFKIYPNPFKDLITLKNEQSGNYQLEIFSSTGALIFKETINEPGLAKLDLSKFEKGLYYLRMTDNYGNQNLKTIHKN